jgi:hypothetical protein
MAAKRDARTVLRDIGLFFASPAVALAYLALFPIIGAMVLSKALKARRGQSG